MKIRGFFSKIMDAANKISDDIMANEKIKLWEETRELSYHNGHERYNERSVNETGETLRKKDLILLSMRFRARTAADINYCDVCLQRDNYMKGRLNEVRRRVSKSDSVSAKELRDAIDLFIGKASS
ncbi:hypothetical protein M5G20_01630 [Pseudomonas sp. TNT2022 ID1044]|uniref:hypothetical protein n=1 Tax=Pseudomonas sp. TNT2022 ID1044 TaxID=2942636 RepID=UPI00236239EF|nr:hypothetical protein [Pseudomonas sp. TNT2022 ID1044]MDD0994565.1 hypothetical protein [Pseudomonas sp. TNT2022 ID1044]